MAVSLLAALGTGVLRQVDRNREKAREAIQNSVSVLYVPDSAHATVANDTLGVFERNDTLSSTSFRLCT